MSHFIEQSSLKKKKTTGLGWIKPIHTSSHAESIFPSCSSFDSLPARLMERRQHRSILETAVAIVREPLLSSSAPVYDHTHNVVAELIIRPFVIAREKTGFGCSVTR